MNKILGRICLEETGTGIPNLLVTIYDVDLEALPEEALHPDRVSRLTEFWNQLQGNRLGSVLTDKDGNFQVECEDCGLQSSVDRNRPNLVLFATAPEKSSLKSVAPILHISKGIRQNAGSTESYLIQLNAKQLEEAGVPVPSDANEADLVVHKITKTAQRNASIAKSVSQVAAEQVDQERQLSHEIETELKPRLLEAMTGVPANMTERFNYVPPGKGKDEVDAITWRTINKNIKQVVNKQLPVVGYVSLTDEQAGKFKDNQGNYRNDISAGEIEPLLYGLKKSTQPPASLLRVDPISTLCREQTLPTPLQNGSLLKNEHKMDKDANNLDSQPPTKILSENAGDRPVTQDDILSYIDRLIRNMETPENRFTIGQRPSEQEVQEKVGTFELRGGPADVPAYYDFHNLQIAFEHVWQHAIDEDVLDWGEAVYRKTKEMGGKPLPAILSSPTPFQALRTEWRNVQHALTKIKIPMATTTGLPAVGSITTRPFALAQLRPIGPNIPNGIPGNHLPGSSGKPVGGNGYSSGQGRPSRPGPLPEMVDDLGDMTAVDPTRSITPNLLEQLEHRLNAKDYVFTVYAPNSVNFGILITYRQKWEPISYQVGELISTVPLAPREVRKFTTKKVIKEKRAIKEMRNNLRIHKVDSSDTTRAEAEIVNRADAKTNFSLTAQGSFKLGIAKGDSTSSFGKDASTSSQDTKKAFHEAVFKAAEEYRNERKMEVKTEVSTEVEETQTGEISNMNDELSVTYLFYELQRRYRVSEQIHRVTPVVLVALEVPRPDQITLGWLAEHDWILNRVLLDDSFRAPLMYLRRIVGEEYALQEQFTHLNKLRTIVADLKEEILSINKTIGHRYAALERSIERRAEVTGGEEGEGILEKGLEWFGGGGSGESEEAARIREDAARDAYERAAKEEKEVHARLEREVTALQAVTDDYTKSMSEHQNQLTDVARLRVHVMQNILYYMQAIWNHTPPDQLFFQLHKVKAPKLLPKIKTYSLRPTAKIPTSVTPLPGHQVFEVMLNLELEPSPDPEEDFAKLAEIADLDNPLGFKGNYLILPLKQSNALTDYMLMPYVDDELGLHDPDELGNWTLSSFVEYVSCLKKHLPASDFEVIQEQLRQQYKELLTAPRLAEEEVVVPTTSLYIEALPGAHPLLEDFKLLHRAIDVKKVQAEDRKMELENLRRAARILAGERADPDIEKKIIIEGETNGVVLPDNN